MAGPQPQARLTQRHHQPRGGAKAQDVCFSAEFGAQRELMERGDGGEGESWELRSPEPKAWRSLDRVASGFQRHKRVLEPFLNMRATPSS